MEETAVTVEDLMKNLEKIPKENRDKEVFFRKIAPVIGNIASVDEVKKDTYGFFGKSIDCYILEHNG